MPAVKEYEAVIREHSTEEEGVDKNSPDWHQVPFVLYILYSMYNTVQ
jgi:hypothetical protein